MDKHKTHSNKNTAFSLVELIIVITILAILATIAFISFKNYSGNARDSNRLATVSQISSGLDIYHLKTSEYPFPEENIYTGVIQNNELVYRGEISSDISRKINISKVPKDPEYVSQNYIYGITYNKQEYQIGTLLENNFSYSKNLFIENTYANSNSYKAGVKGNYKRYIKFSSGSTVYIANIPSLLYNFSGSLTSSGVDLTDKNVYFIVNNGDNLPYSLGENSKTNINHQNKDIIVVSQEDINNYINNNILPQGVNEEDLLSGFDIQDKKDFEYILNDKSVPSESSPKGSGNVILSSSEINQGESVTISNDCKVAPTGYVSSNDNIARIVDGKITTYSAGNITISPIGGECINNYGVPLVVIPSELWKQEDSNCNNNDFVFTYNGTKYIWGGCNSTLGEGLTFQNDNDNSCRNYDGREKYQVGCDTLSPINYYNSLNVGGAPEMNTIWGKLYTWDQASENACPLGWHLPVESEWVALETYLNDGVDCRNNLSDWQCEGLGWSGNQYKKTYNNIVKALKLPLSGNRDGYPDPEGNLYYHARGERTLLWTSDKTIDNNPYYRYMSSGSKEVSKLYTSNNFGLSARCVKTQ